MSWSEVMVVSLGYALVLAALFTAVIVGGLLVARDALLDGYPPAIRERHGSQSPRGKRTATAMGLLNALLFVAVPVVGVLDLHGRAEGTLGFWPAFALGGTAFLVLTLADLLVLDWWLFCTVQPRFMVLPGTDGMPEYRDYAFHWRGYSRPRPSPGRCSPFPVTGWPSVSSPR